MTANAAPYNGKLGTIGFKPQASAGSAEATVTRYFPTGTFSMNASPEFSPRLTSAGTGAELPSKYIGKRPGGSLGPCEMHGSFPYGWYYLLGSETTTTPSGDARLHTITENTAGPVRLTAEGNKVFWNAKQADVYFSKGSFTVKPGELAQQSFEWVGLSHTEDATLTSTPAFTTDPLTCTAVKITLGGSEVFVVDEVSVEIDRNLDAPMVLTSTAGGQPQTVRPLSRAVITGSINFIDFPTAELTKFLAGTTFALVVEVQGDTIATTYKYYERFTFPCCQYTGGLDNEIAGDLITGTAEFRAFYDTVTSSQITIECEDKLTAITA